MALDVKAWFAGLREKFSRKRTKVLPSDVAELAGDPSDAAAPESPAPAPAGVTPLGGVLGTLFSRRRREAQSRRRQRWSIVLVVLAVLGGVGWWTLGRQREVLPGPDLRQATPLEELLYAPLGVPLTTMAYADLAYSGVRQSVPILPVPQDFAASGDLEQISDRGWDALFLRISGDLFPLALRVTGKSVAVKWGLRPGEGLQDVERQLGAQLLNLLDDSLTYRDDWGSEVQFFFREDRIQAVEWRYPPGLWLP